MVNGEEYFVKTIFEKFDTDLIYHWEDYFDIFLSEDNLRNSIHKSKELFRISTHKHPSSSYKYLLKPDEIFHYVCVVDLLKSYVFVQEGEIKYTNLLTKEEVTLRKNDFYKFNPGRYEYEINGECTHIRLHFFEEIPEIFEVRKKTVL